MRQLLSLGLVAALSLGAGVTRSVAQDTVTDTAKKAGEATKEGAKKTEEVTKEGAKKTAATTKAVTHEATEKTKTAAKKTADVTTDTTKAVKGTVTGGVTVLCNDGKKHTGKTNTAACADHGGVKP